MRTIELVGADGTVGGRYVLDDGLVFIIIDEKRFGGSAGPGAVAWFEAIWKEAAESTTPPPPPEGAADYESAASTTPDDSSAKGEEAGS